MMLTRASLTDPAICPVCAAPLSGLRCDSCGALLTGPDAARVWQLSQQIAGLLGERDVVIARLRAAAQTPAPDAPPTPVPSSAPVPAGFAPPAGQPVDQPWQPPLGPPSYAPPPAPAPGPSWFSRLGVHGVLLAVGALLLAAAAIGFLVYSWQLVGLPLRATIIAGITAGVLLVSGRLRRRLPDAAEAIGWLGVILVLADAWAVRSTGLAGADQAPPLAYAAGAAAVCAALLAGWAWLFGLRAGSISAAVLGPLALVLAGAQLHPPALAGQGLPLGLVAGSALTLPRARLARSLTLERRILAVAAPLLLGVAVLVTVAVPASGQGPYSWTAAVLALCTLLAGAQAAAEPREVGRRAWSAGAGALLGITAAETGQALVRSLTTLPPAWIDDDGTAVAALSPWVLIPMALTAAAASGIWLPPVRRLLAGRTAVRPAMVLAGSGAIASLLAVPVLLHSLIGIAQTLSVSSPAWGLTATTVLRDAGGGTAITSARGWLTALAGLLLLAGWTVALDRFRVPAWVTGPVRAVALAAAALAVIVLAMAPWLPLWACVLILLVAGGIAGPGRAWPLSAVSVTMAVLLSWGSRDLSPAVTALAAAGLLLARRRVGGSHGGTTGDDAAAASADGIGPAAVIRAAMAAAGSAAGLVALQAAAVRAGLPGREALVALALVAAALLAGLIGSPRGLVPPSPGRASWPVSDRLAAAAPAAMALLAGGAYWWTVQRVNVAAAQPGAQLSPWAAGLPYAGWRAPVLTVAVLVVLAIGTVRPLRVMAQRAPGVPVACAGLLVPLAGLLAVQVLDLASAGLAIEVVLAAVAGAAGVALGGLGLLTWVLPATRRAAAETGILATGVVALALAGAGGGLSWTDLEGRVWLVLLLLGTGAAAIATSPDRIRVRWLAGLLLAGSSWARLAASGVTVVEAYTLPPAAVLLGLSLLQIRRRPASAPRLLLQVATLALAPSILASWSGAVLRPALLLTAAAALAGSGILLSGRRREASAGAGEALASIAALAAAATAGVRVLGNISRIGDLFAPLISVEVWTLPAAAVLLLTGIWFGSVVPGLVPGPQPGIPASWYRTGPGLVYLLVPSSVLLLADGAGHAGPVRITLLTALASTTLFLGAARRVQAPVVLGAGALVLDVLVYLVPWVARIQAQLPPWVLLAVAGLVLLVLGATYERRLRQLKDLRLLVAALN